MWTSESIYSFFSNYLVMIQCVGLLPVCGIKGYDYTDLHFKWKSFRTCYSIFTICILTLNSCIDFYCIYNSPEKQFLPIGKYHFCSNHFNCSIFTGTACTRINFIYLSITYFRLAMNWPAIMTQWSKIDDTMFSYKCRQINNKKSYIFTILSIISCLSKLLGCIHM